MTKLQLAIWIAAPAFLISVSAGIMGAYLLAGTAEGLAAGQWSQYLRL